MSFALLMLPRSDTIQRTFMPVHSAAAGLHAGFAAHCLYGHDSTP